jgi:hypothetical protein
MASAASLQGALAAGEALGLVGGQHDHSVQLRGRGGELHSRHYMCLPPFSYCYRSSCQVMYWDVSREGSGRPLRASSTRSGGGGSGQSRTQDEIGDMEWSSWTWCSQLIPRFFPAPSPLPHPPLAPFSSSASSAPTVCAHFSFTLTLSPYSTFGFPVMGIVSQDTEHGEEGKRMTGAGTGINGCDMSRSLRCVVTAESSGFVKLFNAPCIVKDAPHRAYIGHGGLGGGVSKVQ